MAVTYTDAQRRATKKYRSKHRERTNYLNKRTVAKTFITKYGTLGDIRALQKLIDVRLDNEEA
ncbi:hypothetical protein [Lentilactobacillus parakefiri]|uniref:Uncharacterized protein n=1 Tax=Lentilactobacillus parakefiri TaxID=152332 RepID=A0A269YFC3_9LACO|nr:hypothetical protein [Lentilactobacillus parakefiri]PAK84227.1 hypothetical protein B8W98_05315 [Lentilactobacillus parakefiri]PAK99885.1 hypothetical protein B8W96_09315 [Lentilactobacillus parakefiri]TDG92088.1 hypothetical protein C5L28_001479 [Lentilactobacillus parakefiri]GAW72012.1 hypothetical protein LPKJCM_01120 [Lentilactobacillus parakefiri]